MITTKVPPPKSSIHKAKINRTANNTSINVGMIDKPNPIFAKTLYLFIFSKGFVFLLCLISLLAVIAKANPKAGIKEKHKLIIEKAFTFAT